MTLAASSAARTPIPLLHLLNPRRLTNPLVCILLVGIVIKVRQLRSR